MRSSEQDIFDSYNMDEPLTALEQATPLAVEAYFRYNQGGMFKDFIRANAPRFQNFREESEADSGKGFDLQMFLVHKEYLTLVETKLGEYLRSLGTSAEKSPGKWSRIGPGGAHAQQHSAAVGEGQHAH